MQLLVNAGNGITVKLEFERTATKRAKKLKIHTEQARNRNLYYYVFTIAAISTIAGFLSQHYSTFHSSS